MTEDGRHRDHPCEFQQNLSLDQSSGAKLRDAGLRLKNEVKVAAAIWLQE
jgi:hypothetical protein